MRNNFIQELESLRANFLAMGDMVLESVTYGIQCIYRMDAMTLDHAKELEGKINASNRSVYDQALLILTLQSPVASDARFITGIIESVVDLEEIGDYALDVSEMALASGRQVSSEIVSEVATLGERSRETLIVALENWRTTDQDKASSVRAEEGSIRADSIAITEKCYQLNQMPGDTSIYVNIVLICRYLSRMARHAAAIAEQAAAAVPTGR